MAQQTPLYEQHVLCGARMVDFHGWMMPLHYGSQIDEHHAVRTDAGMFDVSHMTIVDLRVWQFGSAMVIFLAALQNVPQSQYEAAMIDGASKWQMFMKVTVPLITPVIFFNFIMQTTQAFQEFTGPYVITGGGPTYSTYLFSLYIYDTAFKYFDMGYGAALAWILFLVVAVFAGIAFKSSKYWVFYSADKGGKNG